MIFTLGPIHQMSQTFSIQQSIVLIALEIFSIYSIQYIFSNIQFIAILYKQVFVFERKNHIISTNLNQSNFFFSLKSLNLHKTAINYFMISIFYAIISAYTSKILILCFTIFSTTQSSLAELPLRISLALEWTVSRSFFLYFKTYFE